MTGGCAKDAVSTPPITAVPAASSCTPTPQLSRAVPLSLSGEKELPLTLTIDQGSACAELKPGAKSLYAIVSLPTMGADSVISVASEPMGVSIFAPQVELLDEKGKVVREIPRDDFMFRGGALTALIRAHAAERYLVVASDPQEVGHNETTVVGATQQQMMSSGTAMFMIYTGSETKSDLTYSHGGTVKVVAQAPTPKS
jgi:hypothetical protein